jgi:hypothetical protein
MFVMSDNAGYVMCVMCETGACYDWFRLNLKNIKEF